MGMGMGMGFLKLIFASVEQMRPSLHEDEYLSWTKKLLSLMTPVGSIHLSVLCSPFDEQLSMLYNRFSSLMLTICIPPIRGEHALPASPSHAATVNFGRSTMVTCSVCIHAANYLALQALDMVLPVGPALDWTSGNGQVLISKFRAAVAVAGGISAPPANDNAHRHRSELVQCIQLLLSGLQDMSRTVTTFVGKNTSMVLETVSVVKALSLLACPDRRRTSFSCTNAVKPVTSPWRSTNLQLLKISTRRLRALRTHHCRVSSPSAGAELDTVI